MKYDPVFIRSGLRCEINVDRIRIQCGQALKVLLTFNKVEKTKLESFDFVHLLSSFFFGRHKLKGIL